MWDKEKLSHEQLQRIKSCGDRPRPEGSHHIEEKEAVIFYSAFSQQLKSTISPTYMIRKMIRETLDCLP